MADKQVNQGILTQLQKMFRIGAKKPSKNNNNTQAPSKTIYPLNGKLEKHKWSNEQRELFDWFISNTRDFSERWTSRESLYFDMSRLHTNCQAASSNLRITLDEIIQADSNNQTVFVDAKRKQKKFIEDFFDSICLSDIIRPTMSNVLKFGDAFWIPEFSNKGISSISKVDPIDVVDILLFNASDVQKKIKGEDSFFNDFRKMDRMEQYINSILEKAEYGSFFKDYLFGYIVGDRILPPWKAIHFANRSDSKVFAPFSEPPFINAMSPYLQYDSAMALQVTMRGLKFPKEVYKLNLPNISNPTEKLEKAMEFMNELQNSGFGTGSGKSLPGLGEIMVTINELFDYEIIQNDIDLGKLGDIAMLRDDIYNAFPIPRRILDPNDGGFGDSGISLIEEWKPFARDVYRYQSIFLSGLTQATKIHMITSGEFSIDEIDFTLSMPYPESQTNSDIIDSQSSFVSLINDIAESLSDNFLDGESLPPDVLKQLYVKFLPYDDEIVNKWVDETIKASEEPEDAEVEEDSNRLVESAKIKSRKKWRNLKEQKGYVTLKEEVSDIIFDHQQDVIREAKICNRHVYSSRNPNSDFQPEQLREFDILRARKSKLEENELHKLTVDREEGEYKFTFDADTNSHIKVKPKKRGKK